MMNFSCREAPMLPRNNYRWPPRGIFEQSSATSLILAIAWLFPWITCVPFPNMDMNDRVVSKSEAIIMLIQCPNCGFSGKVPKRAFEVPHQARCKRCHHHFDLSGLVSELAPVASRAWISGIDPAQADHVFADASSSSYELKAITDDFGLVKEADGLGDQWHDEEHDAYRRAAARLIEASNQTMAPEVLSATSASVAPTAQQTMPLGSAIDPWYSRVLEAWGVFFLIWATIIVVRSLLSLLARTDGQAAGNEIVSEVFSVLLLVPGAAGLFLLADVGRYIRDLRIHAPAAVVSRTRNAGTAPLTVRLWRLKAWIHRASRAVLGP